jgi:hypothetical protein
MSSSNTRKRDRYEARARELALAAGVDLDSRIERPGQRSMPAWCAYRDAARAECVATETRLSRLSCHPSGWCLGTPLALQKRETYNRPRGAMDAQEKRGTYRCRSIQITSLW